jgi:NADPH-dependent 2,4-dienoyl-CoA reductase/sulfur reductase-like enzyme
MRLVIIGGSGGLRARQLDPTTDVRLVVADDYPNYSICGIPYHVSGEVPDWRTLAHRTRTDFEAAGLTLHLNERATRIDAQARTVSTRQVNGQQRELEYDRLVIATGAVPQRPPIDRVERAWPSRAHGGNSG